MPLIGPRGIEPRRHHPIPPTAHLEQLSGTARSALCRTANLHFRRRGNNPNQSHLTFHPSQSYARCEDCQPGGASERETSARIGEQELILAGKHGVTRCRFTVSSRQPCRARQPQSPRVGVLCILGRGWRAASIWANARPAPEVSPFLGGKDALRH